jgi:Bacterial Ig-like domain (group 2)
MFNLKWKLRLSAAFAALLSLAAAVSCHGFFVNSPSAVTISPSSIPLVLGQSQQLSAQASFNSGPPQDVTASAVWESSNACVVGVSSQTLGQVTAVGSGGAVTITAIYNGVSGTATATGPTGVTINPCGTFNSGTSQSFTANLSGQDVTLSSTWSSSDANIVNFANPSSSLATFGPTKGTATITADNSGTQGQLQVKVQ